MTRKEEIKQAAYNQFCNSPSITFNLQCEAFEKGAEWADNNPVIKVGGAAKNYQRGYEEALERAKYALTTDMDNSGHWAVKHIFPELKENEEGMEIPFGAKDSELIEETYFIPEGMEAVIQGDKVIIRKKESEDERIKKEIMVAVNLYCTEYSRGTKVRNDMLAWLEKAETCRMEQRR